MSLDETNTSAEGQETATKGSETSMDAETGREGVLEENAVVGSDTDENVSGEGEDLSALEAPPEDPYADYEDFEFNGKKYKLHPEMKDGYMRMADYTRKTQEAAEMKRTLEAEQRQLQASRQMSDDEFNARMMVEQTKIQLEQFKDVNWDREFAVSQAEIERAAMDPNDPMAAIEAQQKATLLQQKWAAYNRLLGINKDAAHYLDQAANQRTQEAERETANRLRATAEYAQREIKGWTPEIDAKVTRYAYDQGITEAELKDALNPRIYKILHDAWLGQQWRSRQQAAKPAKAEVTPTSSVTTKGNPTVRKNPDSMSMAEYAAFRAAQDGRKT